MNEDLQDIQIKKRENTDNEKKNADSNCSTFQKTEKNI